MSEGVTYHLAVLNYQQKSSEGEICLAPYSLVIDHGVFGNEGDRLGSVKVSVLLRITSGD